MKRRCVFVLLIILIVILSIFLFFRGRSDIVSFKRFSQTEKQMQIDQLISKSKEYKIVQTEVYYVPFHVKTNTPLSEKELLSTIPHVKVIGSRLASYPRILASLLGSEKLTEANDIPKDFRYSCLIYSNSDEYIQFSITHLSPDVLFINGQPFKVTFKMIDAFLKLLPVTDYQSAMEYWGKSDNYGEKEN